MSVDDSYEDGDFKRYLQSKNYDDNDIGRMYFDYVVNRLYQGKDVSDYPKSSKGIRIGATYTGQVYPASSRFCRLNSESAITV